MIGRGSSSSLLDHVTGVLFWFHVKLFLPSMFNSVDFWSSMSCIVLVIEFADLKANKALGFLSMGKFRDSHFVLQKSTNPQDKRFGVQESCSELCGTVGAWITMSFPTFFLEM